MNYLLALAVALMAGITAAQQNEARGDGQFGWSGRLQVRDSAFVDDRGQPVLPLCAHFGEAFSAWTRRPAEVDAQLQRIARAGYDCIRFWDHLGEYSDAWRGKEVTPFSWTNAAGVAVTATPAYYDKLEQFLSLLARHGLAAHHSRGDLGRGSPAIPLASVVEHSRTVARIYDRVGWHVLALYEANNEDFQNGNFGPSGLLRIVEPLKERGALVASSCALACSEDQAAVRRYSRGFSVRYYHSRRDGTAAERLKRKFVTGYDPPDESPVLAWDGEPIGPNVGAGPGVTVNSTEDVEELGLLHLMTLVGGKSAATYMSQHGVFWNGPIDEQPGFYVTPRLRAVLRGFAPDVMRWTLYHGSRREAVLRSPDGYFGDRGVTRGPARLDQAVSRDRRRVVALVYGGRPPVKVRNDLKCAARLTVVTPLPTEDVRTETLRMEAGGQHEIDYRIGRLLLAECTD
jgi:hypothetical protein